MAKDRDDIAISRPVFARYGGHTLRFGDPSAVALCLNISRKAFLNAFQIHPFLHRELVTGRGDPSPLVFDYFESILSSVVFAYTALEAFANEIIPEDFYHQTQSESGVHIAHAKKWIEWRSLDEKLSDILPTITKRPSPKGSAVWGGYVQLRRMRHRIIHMTTKDYPKPTVTDPYPKSVWSQLLRPKQMDYSLAARNMMLYFRDKESVYWLKNCPF